MNLTPTDFDLFRREHYAFKQLKAELSFEQVEAIKQDYQSHWQKWKNLQLKVAAELPDELGMEKPKIESWTNGWNVRSHFWSAYRSESRQQENACLAVLLNQKQYQVYLMFQHYRMNERQGTPTDYNQLLDVLPQWSKQVSVEEYFIWPQKEDELADHLPLTEYLASPSLQEKFARELQNGTFQIGKLFFKGELVGIEKQTVQALLELMPLYQALAANP
ncbi:HI_0552 family protein [Enterococcus asini]|uniref:HI_0552 family protein n=1 Tax=Enterococcus asini TaxID=57732 RepID=UPI00288CDE17|nr:HI_0552 family protein [Enterococcus asini]MDT2743809.1 HI_0552 family protein [Enterococcus asini]